MRLASKFLTALEGNFDSSQVEKAFFETNQLFLSQSDVSDEDISDLLDVCKEFFPLPYLTEDKQYEQLWARLEPAYYRHIKAWEQFTQAIAVSYTHLDVYKRQIFGQSYSMNILPAQTC